MPSEDRIAHFESDKTQPQIKMSGETIYNAIYYHDATCIIIIVQLTIMPCQTCTRELVWLLMAGSTQVVYVILIPANVNDMLTRG